MRKTATLDLLILQGDTLKVHPSCVMMHHVSSTKEEIELSVKLRATTNFSSPVFLKDQFSKYGMLSIRKAAVSNNLFISSISRSSKTGPQRRLYSQVNTFPICDPQQLKANNFKPTWHNGIHIVNVPTLSTSLLVSD